MQNASQIIEMAADMFGDRAKAAAWFHEEPLRDFSNVTAEQLVLSGRSDAVVAYLQSIESGSSG